MTPSNSCNTSSLRIQGHHNGSIMSRPTQPGEEKKLLLAPCAEEYTASLKCEQPIQHQGDALHAYFHRMCLDR